MRKKKIDGDTQDYFNNLTKVEIEMSENYWLKSAQQELRSDVKIAEKYTPLKDEYMV